MKHATANAHRMEALASEHRTLDERLRILSRRAFLTPTEQREAAELKRRKLFAKDRIHALSRRGPEQS